MLLVLVIRSIAMFLVCEFVGIRAHPPQDAARTPFKRHRSKLMGTDLAGYSRRTDVWVRPGTATAVSRIPRDLFHPKGPAPK